MKDPNQIIYEFGELEAAELTDKQLKQVMSVANNIEIEAEMEMRKRRYQNKDPDFKTIEERVQQTDAPKIQEFHKSAQRIAEAIKHADERESW